MLNFFKVVPLKRNINKYSSKIIAYCFNSAYKVFCKQNDEVQIIWNDFESITLQMKYIRFCCIPNNSDDLILLSQDDVSDKICLKFYNISNQSGNKTATLTNSSILESTTKVTAFNGFHIVESQLFLSIGLDNGNILYSKTNVQKENLSNAFKYINVNSKPIKGIKFVKNNGIITMFVCSDGGIFTYTISNNVSISETKLILDDMNSSIHCLTLKPSFQLTEDQYLVVARDDGLYCYTTDGRGPCYGISGRKQAVEWFGRQFIAVLKIKPCYVHQTISQVLVYDIDNKIVVLERDFHEDICLLPIPSHCSCLILLRSGEIYTLIEHDMRYKLSQLIKKKLYDIALKMLKDSKANIDDSDMLIQYGDYLLQRGDSLGAVTAYSKTIGIVSPFLIIKKLMGFRHNEFLVQYLSKLVQTEFKIPVHLELLNNCVRRLNLPQSALRVFEVENTKYKYLHIIYGTLNYNSNVLTLINNLKSNLSFSPYFCYEFSNAEIAKFVKDYGYFLIKEYPFQLKELTILDNVLNNMLKEILLPLSLMNKLCAPYIVDSLINDSEKISIYNILVELILQMWHKRQISTDFVMQFIKLDHPEIAIDNIFVLCRHYNFWPGIKMMYDKYSMEILSTNYLLNCFEIFPEYIEIFSQEYSNNQLNQVVVRSIKKEELAKRYTLKYITEVVHSNPYHILNILNNFVIGNDFIISHLDGLLANENYLTYFKCDKLYKIVSFLEKQVIHMEGVVQNYSKRPIEFRNRLCDICKLIINQPSVFFLCQHSFHRECFLQFSQVYVCIVCTDIQKSRAETINSAQSYNKMYNHNVSKNTMLVKISKKIGQLSFKSDCKNLHSKVNQMECNPEMTNPHKKKARKNFTTYDDNSNPFNNI